MKGQPQEKFAAWHCVLDPSSLSEAEDSLVCNWRHTKGKGKGITFI